MLQKRRCFSLGLKANNSSSLLFIVQLLMIKHAVRHFSLKRMVFTVLEFQLIKQRSTSYSVISERAYSLEFSPAVRSNYVYYGIKLHCVHTCSVNRRIVNVKTRTQCNMQTCENLAFSVIGLVFFSFCTVNRDFCNFSCNISEFPNSFRLK